MTKWLLTLLISFVSITALQAQEPTEVPRIIHHLLTVDTLGVPVIYGYLRNFVPDKVLAREQRIEIQYLARSSKGLFAKINGSGKLYQVSESAGQLHFQRIDSTFYDGADFFAYTFTKSDSIMAFGGYGFWRNNGLLKYYNLVSHEWVRIATDKEIAATTGDETSFWLDDSAQKLYIGNRVMFTDETSGGIDRKKHTDSLLWVLDFTTKKWMRQGRTGSSLYRGFNSPWGLLCQNDEIHLHFLLNDFKNNRVLKINPTTESIWLAKFAKSKPEIYYFRDSTLFFGNLTLNSFDSMPFSRKDFMETDQQVYQILNQDEDHIPPSIGNWDIKTSIAVISILVTLLTMAWAMKQKRATAKTVSNPTPEHQTTIDGSTDRSPDPKPTRFGDIFSGTEMALIQMVLEKTKAGDTANADDINRVLGLAQKPETIQKKNRSEVITAINRKWALLKKKDVQLIQRQRSEMDGRYFDYHIDSSDLDAITRE